MKHSIFAATALLWLLALAGCSTAPVEEDQTLDWGFEGKFSLRSPDKNQTGYIRWKQFQHSYEIKLWGLLGVGTTTIVGNDERVLLDHSGKIRRIEADELVEITPGVFIPLGELAEKSRRIMLNGDPSKITRFGPSKSWEARTLSSVSYNDISRPTKVRIKNDDTRLLLLMKNWLDLAP